MTEFSPDFLSNQIFEEEILTNNYHPDARYPASKSAVLQPNGDYLIRICAPDATEVKLIAEFGDVQENGYCPWKDMPIYAVKNQDGIFEATLPHGGLYKTGVRNIDVYLDGTLVIWPFLPICWSGNRPVNFIESPDTEMEFCYIRKVPHGSVINELFWSEEFHRYERCVVYTPPGYMNSQERYPVLYMFHGGGDNETSWFSTGRANYIFDNLIAEGRCVPFIAVSVNNMYHYSNPDGQGGAPADDATEDVLIRSCIPHIDATFRTKADKWNRALCGLSYGALKGSDCGFRYPEIFGNLGFFTSIFSHDSYTNVKGRPWPEYVAHPEKISENYKILYCSATPQEDHYDYCLNDERLLREAGLEKIMPGYVRRYHDPRFTRWCSWRMGLRDFATLLFQ